MCEWCGRECAGVCASRHAVCERGTTGGRDHVRAGRGTCVRTPRVCETPRVSAPVGVSSVVSVSEARRVSERPCVGCVRTAFVRSLYTREMSVAMYEHAAASPGVSMNVNGNFIVCRMSLATRGSMSARREWRLRLRRLRDQCRVAAVVAIGTVPGLHGSELVVRAVPRTRPPRARLRR